MKVSFVTKGDAIHPTIKDEGILKIGKPIRDVNEFYSSALNGVDPSTFSAENKSTLDYIIPVNPEKILCPALNFKTHSSETNQKTPEFPYFFSKFKNALLSSNGQIMKHPGVEKLDYEGEIAAIIGKKTHNVSKSNAQQSIVGFAVVNDVSARNFQNQFSENLGKNWIMAKAADTFLPVSREVFIGEEKEFDIRTEVNGELRQNGNTGDMIFSFSQMIAYLSKNFTLEPGDMILSGTPSGVAASGKFKFLEKGDRVKISSRKIGSIDNEIA
ncbi:MAG: fumarylacetoacetate hydrolase family protein [Cuniculiplasma sp.]